MGRPIIQLPEDMIRIQEVIWRLRPDVVVETGDQRTRLIRPGSAYGGRVSLVIKANCASGSPDGDWVVATRLSVLDLGCNSGI
jgi:cephalosporin hydroxylase